jgi:hypothetical protein
MTTNDCACTSAKDEALDIYIKLSQSDEVSKEDRKAFYEYLILKLEYLKGLVKEQQNDNRNS